MTVADSLIYPRESDATYPYTDDGNREFLEDKEFIETFTLIAAMGAGPSGSASRRSSSSSPCALRCSSPSRRA